MLKESSRRRTRRTDGRSQVQTNEYTSTND